MTYEFTSPKVAYTLAWPREVLVYELRWVMKVPSGGSRQDAAELLLEEAFVSDEPRDEFLELGQGRSGGFGAAPWSAPTATPGREDMLARLLEGSDFLPETSRPRPYWSQRHGNEGDANLESVTDALQVRWADLVDRLRSRGYLDNAGGQWCVDDSISPEHEGLGVQLSKRIGEKVSWPLDPGEWTEGTFYSLVEAVGDLVARPRRRWAHNFADCGWHYEQFAAVPGQMLYRAQVNNVLAGSGLELATNGEDAGRLVRTVDDARDDLVTQVLLTPDPGDRDAVTHAISLFRARDADRETKRSAVLALHRVLEDRRKLLKRELLSKDEGALFHIANDFDLRHRDGKQRPEYDEAYLGWVFWWYLATVELSDRLIARDTAGHR